MQGQTRLFFTPFWMGSTRGISILFFRPSSLLQLPYLAENNCLKTILLFGAGKSATVLIDYLMATAKSREWGLIIADADINLILQKTKGDPIAHAVAIDVTDGQSRREWIEQANVVISMMPPALHQLVARDCLALGKHLLTASYLDPAIQAMEPEVKAKGLLFLGEMGLDPGIDHMSAMRIIDACRNRNEPILSFKSHCGGLVAPESDDNPWHYKISWNPRNVVLAGQSGAEYLWNGELKQVDYAQLFLAGSEVQVDQLPPLAWYPNRDSLSYIPIYGLETAHTFLRTTLRYPQFCLAWNAIVQAGLANENLSVETGSSFMHWSAPIQSFITPSILPALEFLGLFSTEIVPASLTHSAAVLQYLLERKLVMQPHDKDMVVMLHEFETEHHFLQSSLVVKGEDALRTAMAKTVGLPLGIAASLLLQDKLNISGVHIPIHASIYEPVLLELEQHGIRFTETKVAK